MFFDILQLVFSPGHILFLLIGTFTGVVIGAIPGLSGAMLIALTLPLTFGMQPSHAVTLLVAQYVGSIGGGLLTAILLRIPGTPASMMTAIEGHPLARKMEPARVIALGASASLFGGVVSAIVLILVSRPLADLSLRFGKFEFFSLVVLSLVIVATITRGNRLRGLLAAALGVLLAMPGTDHSSGMTRLTFGFWNMETGFGLLPLLLGLFGVTQAILSLTEPQAIAEKGDRVILSHVFLKLKQWREHFSNMLLSSLIGTWIGILPGIGANVGSIVAYSMAMSRSKKPEEFGKGSAEGLVASEAGNNATVGGALVPLVALGIPGSVIDAILIGALTIHNLIPGPLLFRTQPEVVYAMMSSALIANFAMYAFILLLIPVAARIARVPAAIIAPAIILFCIVGVFAESNRMFDVYVMLAFGLVGIAFKTARIPIEPFVIGFVLAPLGEENLRSGLMISGGDWMPFLTRPLSGSFLAAALLMLLWPTISGLFKRRHGDMK
ncbi:MAG: tripartite tricarboxylate transporter permease [Martelella sp.]|uniref:tripartite tricarboxylate transporter permease n=1 Tax=Martelella sp. TaxID=1969699 RepID=UPI0032425A99